ncbi:MAG TPA: ABC transporter substrate binding protein [Syntrophorhabdaceae bacterium]|nr:ABC transporter substrate binding protein [Syntrophorhabdaceae bacterium]
MPFLSPTSLHSEDTKEVLIIHSYHGDFEWTNGIQAGIIDTLKSYKRIEVFTEYMDLIRNISTDGYLDAMERLYKIKYMDGDKRPHVIIVADDNAFDFVLKRRDGIFKDIPIVFCGVNDLDKNRIKDIKDITGVNEKKSIKETIELAISQSINAKNIGVIAGERLSEKINLYQFKRDMKGIKHNLNVVYLNGLELEEIQKRLNAFEKDDIIIFLSYLRSPKGKVYAMDDVIKTFCSSTKAKIYGTNDIQIKHCVVGGKVVYAYTQGEEAAKMAIRIIKGTKPKKIPVLMDSPNRYIFNGEALKKHGINLSQLPKGSIIINKTSDQILSEWENIFKSNRFFSYEFFRNHGTIMLIIDPVTGTILDANEQAKLYYGYQNLIGKKIQEINTLTEEEVKSEMEKASKEKKNFFNVRHRLSNGDIRDVEVYSYPIIIKNKKFLFSVIFDVTDKLKAQTLKAERDRMIKYIFAGIIFAALFFIALMIFYYKKRMSYVKQLLEKNKMLEEAQGKIKTLSGIIPICMHCKKIRDDQGYWDQLEKFITEHSEAVFSHSLCPDCKEKYYKDVLKK